VLLCGATPALAQCEPAVSYSTTPAIPRPDAWIERQRGVEAELSARSFSAIAVGDSIMQGWPKGLLEAAIGLPTLNAGIDADGASQTLWRLDTMDWSRKHPKYVLILVGTNNLGFPACAVIHGVLAVAEKVHQVFPGAAVNAHDAFVCEHHTPCALYKPGNLHLTAQGYELLSDGLRRFLDK